jgi:hypothetical protein
MARVCNDVQHSRFGLVICLLGLIILGVALRGCFGPIFAGTSRVGKYAFTMNKSTAKSKKQKAKSKKQKAKSKKQKAKSKKQKAKSKKQKAKAKPLTRTQRRLPFVDEYRPTVLDGEKWILLRLSFLPLVGRENGNESGNENVQRH